MTNPITVLTLQGVDCVVSEAFWGATLSMLPAADLAAASVASQMMCACVAVAVKRVPAYK